MILLDTNVVSEAMRRSPNARVLDWLNSCKSSSLHVSSITIAEISYGISALRAGKRRSALMSRFKAFLDQGFLDRILSFDDPAARLYGELMAHRKSLGRPMSILDGQIAAIAQLHGMRVATRDMGGFEETGIDLVNPWAGA